jgi:transcriptional regulator with XRE-family HTH domain
LTFAKILSCRRRQEVTAKNLRARRPAEGIPGAAVCQRSGISRAKLSDIEREYVIAPAKELERIEAAIEEIVRTRQRVAKLAAQAGSSLIGLRL